MMEFTAALSSLPRRFQSCELIFGKSLLRPSNVSIYPLYSHHKTRNISNSLVSKETELLRDQ